jgi:hypothetical protein
LFCGKFDHIPTGIYIQMNIFKFTFLINNHCWLKIMIARNSVATPQLPWPLLTPHRYLFCDKYTLLQCSNSFVGGNSSRCKHTCLYMSTSYRILKKKNLGRYKREKKWGNRPFFVLCNTWWHCIIGTNKRFTQPLYRVLIVYTSRLLIILK